MALSVGYYFCMFILIMALMAISCGRISNTVRRHDYKENLIRNRKASGDVKVLGFFHPFCDAGGGGEKVLFQAISAIQNKASSPVTVMIYSASDKSIKEITDHVSNRFGISVDAARINMVKLKKADKLKPERYA